VSLCKTAELVEQHCWPDVYPLPSRVPCVVLWGTQAQSSDEQNSLSHGHRCHSQAPTHAIYSRRRAVKPAGKDKGKKGEKEYLYGAILYTMYISKRSTGVCWRNCETMGKMKKYIKLMKQDISYRGKFYHICSAWWRSCIKSPYFQSTKTETYR